MFNLSVITDRLLVGSAPMTTADIDLLRDRHGVGAVLNLQTASDLDYHRIDWPVLVAHYRARDILLTHHPVTDFDRAELRENLPGCVADLQELVQAGHIVYVHCNVGVNRSPTTVIAYLHRVEGLPLHQAASLVRARRDCLPYVEVIREAAWP